MVSATTRAAHSRKSPFLPVLPMLPTVKPSSTCNGGVNFTLELLEANGLQCCGSRVIASKYMYYDDGISHKNWSIHIAYNPPQDFSTKFYYFRICSHTNGARWFSDWDTWSLSSYV